MAIIRIKYGKFLERKAKLFRDIVERKMRDEFIHKVGFMDSTADIHTPMNCTVPQKLFFYENTCLDADARFIISPYSEKGNFIMMPHSEAAEGLTVITNTHTREIGSWFGDTEQKHTMDVNKDIVVEEDAWLGANVTLVVGAHIGRGAVIGAGTVCNRRIPPYAIAVGNPAKVIGFVFTPDEIVEHEVKLYPEEKRLRREILDRNYRIFYTERLNEIINFLK